MDLKPIIRNYRPADLESCRALWRELTDWHRQIYQDPSIGGEHPENQFDKHLASVGPGQIWVAAEGSQLLGLVGLIMKENEAEVEPIIVRETHRGKGIGAQLLQTVILEAHKRGVRLLTVKPVAKHKDYSVLAQARLQECGIHRTLHGLLQATMEVED